MKSDVTVSVSSHNFDYILGKSFKLLNIFGPQNGS